MLYTISKVFQKRGKQTASASALASVAFLVGKGNLN